jgi:CDP-diacylglycerol---glycerol-3-phosphate 3-phosphatidyltransferase
LDKAGVEEKKPFILTDYLRKRFKGFLDPLGAFLNRLGLMPNTVTILGLVGNVIAALFLARGDMIIGGLIALAMGPIDALDGTMARLRGEPKEFGAFVDSVTDRYSELVLFGGLLYFYSSQGNWLMTLSVYLAAAGSVLVSYVRARGQSLGMDTKVGLLSRFERYIILCPSLILSFVHIGPVNLAQVGIWIIAIFANITALQRIADVRRQARASDKYPLKG